MKSKEFKKLVKELKKHVCDEWYVHLLSSGGAYIVGEEYPDNEPRYFDCANSAREHLQIVKSQITGQLVPYFSIHSIQRFKERFSKNNETMTTTKAVHLMTELWNQMKMTKENDDGSFIYEYRNSIFVYRNFIIITCYLNNKFLNYDDSVSAEVHKDPMLIKNQNRIHYTNLNCLG